MYAIMYAFLIKSAPIESKTNYSYFNCEAPMRNIQIEDVLNAMIIVESGGDKNAHAKSEQAVGILQIRPIMIREVNRILRINKSKIRYRKKDRWSREKSIEIFMIVYNYHHIGKSFEEVARFWNGGHYGMKKEITKIYWEKVKKELYNQMN